MDLFPQFEVPRIRRLFEQHYIHWHYKQNKPAMVPSEFVAGFDIKLSHRQTYLLDCFIYDWEKDTEQEQREELDGQDPDSAMVGLIEVVSRKCQNVGEFVKDVSSKTKIFQIFFKLFFSGSEHAETAVQPFPVHCLPRGENGATNEVAFCSNG